MRKLSVSLASILGLIAVVSCTDPGSVSTCPVEPTTITGRISVCLPADWTHVSQNFGEEGSIVALFFPAGSTGSVMRLHIKQDPLGEPVRSHMEFAERAVALTRESAPNYKAIDTLPISINKKQTLLHIFEANPEETTDPVRYYQFVLAHGGLAYGITAVMHPGLPEEQINELVEIIKSTTFK